MSKEQKKYLKKLKLNKNNTYTQRMMTHLKFKE